MLLNKVKYYNVTVCSYAATSVFMVIKRLKYSGNSTKVGTTGGMTLT